MDEAAGYRERLWAPVTWWVVVLVLLGTLAIAVGVPLGPVAGLLTMAGGTVVAVWLLLRAAALVEVRDRTLTAGRARLPLTVVATVTALDGSAARALRGPDADARAYLLLRPWVATAVRVDLTDPARPDALLVRGHPTADQAGCRSHGRERDRWCIDTPRWGRLTPWQSSRVTTPGSTTR